ncbi:MAG: CcmD family protein [Chitinophagales bacterium]
MKKGLAILIALIYSTATFAQSMAPEFMLRGLKLYVVIGVLCIILTGLFTFLFAIEKRLKKLEESAGTK